MRARVVCFVSIFLVTFFVYFMFIRSWSRSHSTPTVLQKQNFKTIPKIVHFIFGLSHDYGGKPFSFVHYLAIMSAFNAIKPSRIYLHYIYEPSGEWWEKVKGMVTLNKIKPISFIFGNHIKHVAHMSDVIRLRVLLKYGGIYLDMDVISLKPFDDLLTITSPKRRVIMGQEGEGGRIGLCNAVIIAAPNSEVIRKWLSAYSTFDSSQWNYHSVILPQRFASEITVLNHKAFFWPLWDHGGLKLLFESNTYNFEENYAVHLWEKNSFDLYLKHLTPEMLKNPTTSFLRAVATVLYES